MEKILLNIFTMDEALSLIKTCMEKDEATTHFKVQCINCTLSIATNGRLLEVALRNVDDTDWISLKDPYYDDIVKERNIIYNLPIVLLPAMINQFENMECDNFDIVWDAYDNLACIG